MIEQFHDYFVAGASVAGALIGLLFVAMSVSRNREKNHPLHRVRASAALTAFMNALTVCLFGLVPGEDLGAVVVVVACVGLLAMTAAALFLIRADAIHLRSLFDIAFVAGLGSVFVVQLVVGLHMHSPYHAGDLRTVTTLVTVCFLIGVGRTWELIGGRSTSLLHEVHTLGQELMDRGRDDGTDTPAARSAGPSVP